MYRTHQNKGSVPFSDGCRAYVYYNSNEGNDVYHQLRLVIRQRP